MPELEQQIAELKGRFDTHERTCEEFKERMNASVLRIENAVGSLAVTLGKESIKVAVIVGAVCFAAQALIEWLRH